jgi:hypothetical protein
MIYKSAARRLALSVPQTEAGAVGAALHRQIALRAMRCGMRRPDGQEDVAQWLQAEAEITAAGDAPEAGRSR